MPPPLATSLEPKLKDYRGGYGSVSRMVLERLLWIVLFVRVVFALSIFILFVESEGVKMASSERRMLISGVGLVLRRSQI